MSYLFTVVLFVSVFAWIRIMCTLFHELGHALTGLMFFRGKTTIYLGSNENAKHSFHFSLGRLTFHCKCNLTILYRGLCKSEQPADSFWRNFLVVLAGPLASLLTALGSFCILILSSSQSPVSSADLQGFIRLVAAVFFFFSFIDFFYNIIPYAFPIRTVEGGPLYNDGRILLEILRLRRVYQHALAIQAFQTTQQVEKGIVYFERVYSKLKDENILRTGIDLYRATKNHRKAIQLYRELEEQSVLNARDYGQYALAYSYAGEHQTAYEYYTKSLELDATDFYSLLNRAYTLNALERYEEAIVEFNQVIEINPQFAYAYSNRGLAKFKLGQEEGLQDIEQALALDANDSYAYKNLGIYHLDKGSYNQALEYFSQATALDAKTHGLDEVTNKAKAQLSLQENGDINMHSGIKPLTQ